MTKRIDGTPITIIVEPEPHRACELCGTVAECRPYGPGGKQVCYECAMKDPKGTDARMGEYLFGDRRPKN